MHQIKVLLRATRLPFLILTPICVFLGFSTAYRSQAGIDYIDLSLILLGAVCAHISVNSLNEYLDFHSGLDARTKRTPFSGGSGALIDQPQANRNVLLVALTTLGITILVGGYFIYHQGMLILPIGVLGILIILTYTQWINRHPILCLLAPGVGFGPLMVMGTAAILSGSYSLPALVVSLVPLFLVSNLLLLNQLPDIEADKSVGRYHLPIAYGWRVSTIVYAVFAAASGVSIVAGVAMGFVPTAGYAALIPLSGTLVVMFAITKHGMKIDRLIPYLGMNVFITLATPLLLGITLISN
ncbi:prenyltransferase [Pseudomonadota bacterium]